MPREATLHRLASAAPVIAPSMLKCDFGDLRREVDALERAGAHVLHWDVMDGHFVPNLSYGAMVVGAVREQTELVFDAHLMISQPDRYLDDYLRAGCDSVTFHVESVDDPKPLLERIRAADRVAGLSLSPDTPVESIAAALPACDVVLVMSVEPGFGGQEFMPLAIDKIRRIRELARPELLISVDGGIAPDTIGECSHAGADMFVAGSSIFRTGEYGAAIDEMRGIAVRRRTTMSC